MSVWTRIKEHKVAQWTLAYAAAAYTLLHGTEMVSNAFEWPHLVVRIVTLLLFLGTPLVATTGGAIPEVSGPDGETCLAVPPGDAGALAAALSRLLGDPELRSRLGRAGRERVLARFTWARAAQGTAELYREAIAARGRAARGVAR